MKYTYLTPIHRSLSRSSFVNPFTEELDKFFNNFLSEINTNVKAVKGQTPRVNAYKKGEKYCIDALIPMASREDIVIDLEENLLTITVNARQNPEITDNDYIIREISRGQMTRTFTLGEDINLDSVKSSFKDGILHIEFDSKVVEDAVKTRKIAIE